MPEIERKKCFVAAPIGVRGSDTFLRTEDVQDFIVGPAIEQCNYEMPPIRADQISEPGRITKQIIDHLINDALVVVDLTDRNPNVFYELAIRHAVRKPIVQIIHKSQTIPFDVSVQRTIFYDHQNLREVPRTIKEIVDQIKAAEHNPGNVDTPLSDAIFQQSLLESNDPIQKSNAEILAILHEIRSSTSSWSKNFSSVIRRNTLSTNDSDVSEHEVEDDGEKTVTGSSESYLIPFASGDRVEHNTFGQGTIVRIEEGYIVKVAFPMPIGMKRLDLKFAKLVKA